MRLIIAILYFTTAYLCCIAQDKEKPVMVRQAEFRSDVNVYDIGAGPKMTLRVWQYVVSSRISGDTTQKLIKTIVQKYDDPGNCFYQKIMDVDGSNVIQTSILMRHKQDYDVIEYDKDSSYFKKEQYRNKGKTAYLHTTYDPFDTDTGYVEDTRYITRHKGRLVIAKESVDNEVREVIITRYTRSHKPLRQDYYSGKEHWLHKEWAYDFQEKCTRSVTEQLEDGIANNQDTYLYDANGNIVEHSGENLKYNSAHTRQTYKYDSNNHEIEWCQYLPDGRLEMKGISIYDTHGKLVRKSDEDSVGNVTYEITYRYNEAGLRTETAGRNADSTLHYRQTNEWGDMDLYGNWLKVTEYLDGKPRLITIREITYVD